MRPLLLTSTLLAALVATPVFAQTTVPAPHEPFSRQASNITSADTHSDIAPALPTPDANSPRSLLSIASNALGSNRTGLAQSALERAETRMLDRCVPPGVADNPDNGRTVDLITQARLALGNGNLQQAQSATRQALQILPRNEMAACPMVPTTSTSSYAPSGAGPNSSLGANPGGMGGTAPGSTTAP